MQTNINTDVRKKQLQSLGQYIKSSKDSVHSILDYLGWNPDKMKIEEQKMLNCSLDPNHRMSSPNFQKHLEHCKVKSAGYSLTEEFLSEPSSGSNSIKLDAMKKIEVFNNARHTNPKFVPAWNGHEPDPMTSNRLIATFSADERLALYDYCVQNTEGPPVPDEFNLDIIPSKDDEKSDREAELTRERNSKRRRPKYKSVHTNRKSHKEVMREVIENQMDLYREWLSHQEAVCETKITPNKTVCDGSTEVYNTNIYYPQESYLTEGEYYVNSQQTHDEQNSQYISLENQNKSTSEYEEHERPKSVSSRHSQSHSTYSGSTKSSQRYHRNGAEDGQYRRRSSEKYRDRGRYRSSSRERRHRDDRRRYSNNRYKSDRRHY